MITKRRLIWVSAGLLIAGMIWKAYKIYTSAEVVDDEEEDKKDEE